MRTTTARHLHGKIERTCALSQGKGLIRIGQCRREQRVPSISDSPTKCTTRTTCAQLLVVLAHPQGVAATFRLGQHHYLGPLYEDRSLTHALTDTASTDLTVAEHRWVPSHSARPYLAPTVRKVGPSHSPHVRSRCSQARVSQTQPSAEQERSMCAIWLPRPAGAGEEA